MKDEKSQQELMLKLSMFEQQIRNLQEQYQAVEQAIIDSKTLEEDLNEIKKSKDKDVMASIGKGIYAKAKLTSEELIVDIGGRNFVKKSVLETQNIIKEQVKKFEMIKKEIELNLEKINEELTKSFSVS